MPSRRWPRKRGSEPRRNECAGAITLKVLSTTTRSPSVFKMSQAQKSDGMNYAPKGKPSPVVKPGEFAFAAAHLDHGHIYGQCNGLLEAGAELKWVYDPDPKKVEA